MQTQDSFCRIAGNNLRSLRTLSMGVSLLLFLGQLGAWAQQTIQVPNGSVSALIAAIQTLNAGGGGTINLASGGAYTVNAPSDWWYGPNAFPTIASTITINGNGSTITRAAGSPNFRFFFVSGGFSTLPAGNLTLNDLTLTGGYALGGSGGTGSAAGSGGGGGGAGLGGAIYNQGKLLLTEVNLNQNEATGGAGGGLDPNCSSSAGGGGGLGGNGGNCDGNDISGGGGGMQTSGSDTGNGGNFLGSEGGNGANGGTSTDGGSGAASVGCWNDGQGNCWPTSGSGGGGYAPGQNGGQPGFSFDSTSGLFDPGAGGYGGGAGGYAEPYALSYGPEGYSSGGAFGGGGEGSGLGAGGGGGVGGGGGGGGSFTETFCAQGGIGGFGGGGGGTGDGSCPFPAAGSVFGGGAGGSNSGIAGNGGNGLGGAIFNQLGEALLYSVTFSGNTATGGASPGGSAGNGLGGAVANLDGSLVMNSVLTSGDNALNGDGSAGQGSEVYVTSDAGGLTASGQTPAACLQLVGTSIPSSAIALNQVNGTVTEKTDTPVGQTGGTLTVTVPITQAGTIGPAPYILTGGVLTNVYTGEPVSTDFNPVSGGTCTQGATFAVGQTCTVNYTFTPSAIGLREGAVILLNSSFQSLGIAYISNTAQGTQIAFAPGTQSSIAGNWADGVGATAVDGFGSIYVAEMYDGAIEYISKSQSGGYGTPSVLINGLGMPTSVAFDGAGDIFFTDWLYSAVYELQSYGNLVSLGLDVGWSSPQSVAVDALGNVFVTDFDLNEVVELPWTGTGYGPGVALPTFTFGYMANVAVDPFENVFVTDAGNNQVVEFPFTPSGYGTPIAMSINTPSLWGIATDSVGNLYLSDSTTGAVMSMLAQPSGQFGPLTTVATGINTPLGMAIAPNGNIFVAPGGGTNLVEIDQFDAPTINFATSTSVGSVDTADGPQTVNLLNTGNEPLVFTTPTTGSNPSYPLGFLANALDGNLCTSSAPVAVGGTCDVSVSFMPTEAGSISGSIVLTDNAPGSPQTIAVSGTGFTAPVASLSAGSLSFPSTTIGTWSASQHVTLTNTGNAALSIVSIAVTGTNASSFAFANNCGSSLAVGASCIVQGHFQPAIGGALTATITITDNAANSPQNIALSGTGVVPPVTLSATSLTFPATTVGTWSASQHVTLTNTGTAALSISSIAVTGTNATSFAFANNCGASVAVGASCLIQGHFQPTAAGALKATITITDSATGSPQTIALSGTGVAPPVTLSATSLSFGSVNVGSTSASQHVTITNTGTAALSITSIAVTGTNATSFVFANNCGTSLAVGASCIVQGHFAPAAAGALTAAITLTDSATGSPQSIALTGTGVALPVTLSATSLSFGSVTVGSTSASQHVTITNTGTAALAITSIAVTGTNATSFVFANNCGTSLAVGANCIVQGHFGPTTAGALTAAITITDSATGSPQSIVLSGTGVALPVTLSAKSLSFPATTVGSISASQSVTMTNTGTAALTITSIALTGTNATSFVFANSCGTSLAVGANCIIHGHFAPTATGAATAAITITDSATGSPQSIALSGTGQ